MSRFALILFTIAVLFFIHLGIGLLFGVAWSWGLLPFFFVAQCWLGVQLAKAQYR